MSQKSLFEWLGSGLAALGAAAKFYGVLPRLLTAWLYLQLDVVAAKRGLLSETADLDEQQLQALLEASLLLLSCEPCVAFKLFPVDFSRQETEKKIADHQMKGDLHAIVCSLFADTSWTAAAISV